MKTEEILKQRGFRYGEFKDLAIISQKLKDIVYEVDGVQDKVLIEAIEMIMHKIARIINGDESYIDNWADIAGYATLAVQYLEKGKKDEKLAKQQSLPTLED